MTRRIERPGRRAALGTLLALPYVARADLIDFSLFPVPYVPTPMPVVERMLELARIEPGDTVYDLGCGDGRIVVEAAKRYGVRGIGIDLDPVRVAEASDNVSRAGVGDKVEIRQGDLFETDLSPADVVTLYLLPEVNLRLLPVLWRDLRVGARVVSHDFHMGSDWPSDHTENVGRSAIYSWTIRPEHKQQG
ncbi:MAG: class I SAM-dependent methyltransferase [Burkholderiaceae bacterium]|nr:class I SAM-dependent methyltransferase [Burkholderiaceae bacterium]